MYHLVLLLVHSHSLQTLSLGCNSLSTGFALFCSGLRMNKWLTFLDIPGVILSDDDILLLADALHQHPKLSVLHLTLCNSFQSPVFLQFLQKVFCASSGSCLARVGVDNSQYYPAMNQLESYQASRQQNGLPPIYLEIYNTDAAFSSLIMAETAAIENLEKSLLTGDSITKFTVLCVALTTI